MNSLSSRPNVQSTLILSRENGSIIYASGTLSNAEAPESSILPSYEASTATIASPTPAHEMSQSTVSAEAIDPAPSEPTLAQKLAGIIMTFMESAERLGSSLNNLDPEQYEANMRRKMKTEDRAGQTQESNGKEEEHNSRSVDQDLQLLRLRTKCQEIIIYPDSKFLCCVVQGIGKVAS